MAGSRTWSIVLLTGALLMPAQAAPADPGPAGLARSPSIVLGKGFSPGIAVSADGSRVAVVWSRNRGGRNRVWISERIGARWRDAKQIPGTARDDWMSFPLALGDLQMSGNGKALLLTLVGDVSEGYYEHFVTVRTRGRWSKLVNLGYRSSVRAAVSSDGTRSLVVAAGDWETTGPTIDVLWRTPRRWSAAHELASEGWNPQVALSRDGKRAIVTWMTESGIQAALWDGSRWSAPTPVDPAIDEYRDYEVALSPDGTSAAVAVSEPAGDVGYRLRVHRWTAGTWTSPLNRWVRGWVGVSAVSPDGSLGAFIRGAGDNRSVGSWRDGEVTLTDLNLGRAWVYDSLVSLAGGASVVAWTRPVDFDGMDNRGLSVTTGYGTQWGTSRRVYTCPDDYYECEPSYALATSDGAAYVTWIAQKVSPSGKVRMLQVPGLPGKIRRLRAELARVGKRTAVTLTWRKAPFADTYQVKIGKRSWKSVAARHYTTTLKRHRDCVVKVRARGPGGIGPVRTRTVRT